MHARGPKITRVMRYVLPFALWMTSTSIEAKPAPSVNVLTERCTREAHDAGMPAGGEFSSYVKDCVRDLQDMRKQGLDLEGTHEDPAAQAPPPKTKGKKKKAKKKKPR